MIKLFFFLIPILMTANIIFAGQKNDAAFTFPAFSEKAPLPPDLFPNLSGNWVFEAATSKNKTTTSAKKSSGGPSIINICGYILIAGGLGGLGAGYYFDTQASGNMKDAQKNYDDYKSASSGFDDKWKAYQSSLTLAKQNVQIRNISYIAGGVSLGAGLIMAFLPSGNKQNTGFFVTPNAVYASFRF